MSIQAVLPDADEVIQTTPGSRLDTLKGSCGMRETLTRSLGTSSLLNYRRSPGKETSQPTYRRSWRAGASVPPLSKS